MLNSSLNINKLTTSPLHTFLQFTEDDKHKLSRAGIEYSAIEQIESENDSFNNGEE